MKSSCLFVFLYVFVLFYSFIIVFRWCEKSYNKLSFKKQYENPFSRETTRYDHHFWLFNIGTILWSFILKNIWVQYRSSRPAVFWKKHIFKNFAKFTGNHLCQSLFFNKNADCVTLLRKRLWHRWSPVHFAKFLRIPLFYRTPLVAASDRTPVSCYRVM